MMGPSAIGAQPPPEDMDEWAEQEPEEPWCTCCAEHSIEELDTNCCDSCGKEIEP
jgi:hypothetical protein